MEHLELAQRGGADVARARSLVRRLLVEGHTLTFVELVEARALHRAPVEEQLLANVVTNEPEAPLSHQPLDRRLLHRRYLHGHGVMPATFCTKTN